MLFITSVINRFPEIASPNYISYYGQESFSDSSSENNDDFHLCEQELCYQSAIVSCDNSYLYVQEQEHPEANVIEVPTSLPLELVLFKKYSLEKNNMFNLGYPVEFPDGKIYIEYEEYPQFKRLRDIKRDEIEWRESVIKHQQKLCPLTKVRHCSRCCLPYLINNMTEDQYFIEACQHHPGKLRTLYKGVEVWTCCYRSADDLGCATAEKGHIWSGLTVGTNGPFTDFKKTQSIGITGVYSIDCEMVTTKKGRELARVTVVSTAGSKYDALVKPSSEVLDYHTQFSGIREEDLVNVWKTLEDVQQDLLSFISAESIIVGHGLANDLRVLKIYHENIVDTAEVFPHPMGLPYRNSLKMLVKTHLNQEIQTGEHSSIEDATTTLALMENLIYKIEQS